MARCLERGLILTMIRGRGEGKEGGGRTGGGGPAADGESTAVMYWRLLHGLMVHVMYCCVRSLHRSLDPFPGPFVSSLSLFPPALPGLSRAAWELF